MNSTILVLTCLLLIGSLLPYSGAAARGSYAALERVKESYNVISGRQCIQKCQAECGGICYMTMAFQYICNCNTGGRFGK